MYDKTMESKKKLFRHKGLSVDEVLLVSDPKSGQALDWFTCFSLIYKLN